MHERLVGTLILSRYGAEVLTDNKVVSENIAVPPRYLRGAEDGDKVIVEIIHAATRKQPPMGKVIDVLGHSGDNDAEMHAILAEFGLPYDYPKQAEQEAAEIDSDISTQEIYRRRDMRDVLTFTIDPFDAKDFDDALSFRQISDSEYEIGVHIADVTHYVEQGTLLDSEAYNRATSVYLVDRTIPMLPERLCNELCSLRPNEDKLTMSVIFTMDAKAKVLKHKICRTIIRSDVRLDYDQAQAIIDNQSEQGESVHGGTISGDVIAAIAELNRLAGILREDRFRHGAIDFEREEIKVLVDEQGKPTGFKLEESTPSHHLIEEFMLLANRTVAQQLSGTNKDVVYRVHDVPDPDKIEALSKFVHQFGYSMHLPKRDQKNENGTRSATKAIKKLLSDSTGSVEQELIHTLAIRTMPKAFYSTHNIGHYGLAFPYYTHFTSPIRRYPDMMVHRLVSKYLLSGKTQSTIGDLEESCRHCSDREQLAVAAERASVKYKQAEWMEQHLGEAFDGIVSGVTDYGLYVQLTDSHCEGLLHVRDLGGEEFWAFSEENYCLINERTGEKLTLGDKIRVEVLRADALRRQINFKRVQKTNN
ncbi:MAG: ribonuclease R [Paludibacteraceae bacterium]|nr:ribonuclease R [Paludibacteraceae bacterium]